MAKSGTSINILLVLKIIFVALVIIAALAVSETGDDGHYVAAAHLVSKGLLPLADFSYSQGPVLPYVYAPFFHMLGSTLLASRLVGILFIIAIYYMALNITVSWFNQAYKTEKYSDFLRIALTVIFILNPELWANLARIGAQESVSSFFCLAAIASIFFDPKHKYMGLFISALLVALSAGIKYQSIIIALPLFIYVLLAFSAREAFIYMFFIALGGVIIFMPYLLSGKLDSVCNNLWVIVLYHAYPFSLRCLRFILNMFRILMRFQIILIPSLIYAIHDLRKEKFAGFYIKKHNLLLTVFMFMTLALTFVVSPTIHRVYMYMPLLMVYCAICFGRIYMYVDRNAPDIVPLLRKNTVTVAGVIIFLFLANCNFLIPDKLCDSYFTDSNFSSVRWYFDRSLSAAARELRKLCGSCEVEVLYIGYSQHRITPSGCAFSAFSVGPYNYLNFSNYSIDQAERYKFLTRGLFNKVIEEKRFGIVVVDKKLFENNEPDSLGVNYGEMRQLIEKYYKLSYADKYMAIYISKGKYDL